MKKLGLFAAMLLFMSLVSCKENICVTCTKIVDDGTTEELCSRDRDERQKFQTDLIKAGYNCTAEEQ